jgi:hypothetical protein
MFPNVRLMIAATLASVVVLIGGLVAFAALRAKHEPASRLPLGAGPLQLADGTQPGLGFAPFELRFPAEQIPTMRGPVNLSMLLPGARIPADTVRNVEPPGPVALQISENVAPETPPEPVAGAPAPAAAPMDLAAVSKAALQPATQPAATYESPAPPAEAAPIATLEPEASPAAPDGQAIAAMTPDMPTDVLPAPAITESPATSTLATFAIESANAATASVDGPSAEPATARADTTATPVEAAAMEAGTDLSVLKGKVPLPTPAPAAKLLTAAAPPAESADAVPATDVAATALGTDPPVLTGKIPLPRPAPAARDNRAVASQAAAPRETAAKERPAAKTVQDRPRTAKTQRIRKARTRAVADSNPLSPFPAPNFLTGRPAFQSQFPAFSSPSFQNQESRTGASAPMGGPFVGSSGWGR